jgi:Na+-driven multidrug efflux pump
VRLDFLLMSFAYGFSAAVLTLVGMATGARRPERVRGYVVSAGTTIAGLLALPGLVLWWRPGLWLGLFTGEAAIHAVGAEYFRTIGPSYPFVGVSMVLAFAFQGLGRAVVPLVWTVVRVAIVLALAVAGTGWLGWSERQVFATIAVSNVVSAAVMVVLFVRVEQAMRQPRDTAGRTGS